MNTLLRIYIEYLDAIFQMLYPYCDYLLVWTTKLGGVAGIIVIGVITGLGVNLFQKFFSNQKLLGRCKSDLDGLKKSMSQAKKSGGKDEYDRLMGLSKRISGKYMWGSLKPAFWPVLPIVVVAMWSGSRLGFVPLKSDQPVFVAGYFEDGAKGFAHILVEEQPDGSEVKFPGLPAGDYRAAKEGETLLPIESPISPVAIRKDTHKEREERTRIADEAWTWTPKWWNPLTWLDSEPEAETKKRVETATNTQPPRGPEARWGISATKPGLYKLVVRHENEQGVHEYRFELPVHEDRGRPPEFMNYYNFETPTANNMQSLEVRTDPSMPSRWWNMWLQWMGLYLVVAIVCGFGFRFLLRVN